MNRRDLGADRPYIMLAYLRGLFDYLKARRVRSEPVLGVLRLTHADLLDPDCRVDHALQNDVFDVAERITGDVNVGLHAGEATHLMHFGIGGMLAMTCKTIRELIDVHTRFQRLISTGATMAYVEQGDEVVGEATWLDSVEMSRHTAEYTLASHLTLARLMAGFAFNMSRVELMYPEPRDSSELRRLLGCEVRFGCERERMYFPAAALDIPLVMGDDQTRPLLESEALRRLDALRRHALEDEEPMILGLKRFVAEGLRNGLPSIEDAATALGVSVRTLQRRLEERHSSYRNLVDDVRRDMAGKYLRARDLSQVDIAYLLGYSEQSAFHRAFRRWFSTTPKDYRARTASMD